jgi:hypothetical protein
MQRKTYRETPRRNYLFPLLGVLSALGALAVSPAAAQSRTPKLKTYETKYYSLHTDLDAEGVQEATLRITLMAEEYRARTRGLAGTVKERLPFYLFKNRSDYEAAGGQKNTDGFFTGDKLVAVANPKYPDATWHVVQHEGFHQFVLAGIGPKLPIWANEGLAEYFGQGRFTGDQFIIGLIPPGRLARVKEGIATRRFKSLRDMMQMPIEEWNVNIKPENYDQAWSMVHFLAQAEDGKYQRAFVDFLADVSHQLDWDQAWTKRFGKNVDSFQQHWAAFWTDLPDDPTADLYAQTLASTLTSFFARAFSQRQYFDTSEQFFAAAEAGKLRAHQQDWLPPSLLREALTVAPQVGEWSLERKPGQRVLLCRTNAGTLLEGSFKIETGRVQSVTVRARPERK